MKLRTSLVSNSSSSSFIVAHRTDMTEEEFLEKAGATKDNPLVDLIAPAAKILFRADAYTEEEYLKEYGYETWEKFFGDYSYPSYEWELAKRAFSNNLIVKYGLARDGDKGPECSLCYADIDYQSDDLIIFKHGGY